MIKKVLTVTIATAGRVSMMIRATPERVCESGSECLVVSSVTKDGELVSASVSSTRPERKNSSELQKHTTLHESKQLHFPKCTNLSMK